MNHRDIPYKKRRQIRDARLTVVAKLLSQGYSYSKISKMVEKMTGVQACKSTISNDRKALLKEWREHKRDNLANLITLELARIDATILELRDAWEKSKADQTVNSKKEKGVLLPNSFIINAAERLEKNEIGYGDVRYIIEIRYQEIERRKILGIYAA